MKKDLLPHPKQQVPFTKMDGIHTLSAPKPHSLCTFFDPRERLLWAPWTRRNKIPTALERIAMQKPKTRLTVPSALRTEVKKDPNRVSR